MALDKLELPGGEMSGLVAKAVEYMVDAGQRSVLFLDIMRQRGDQYREHVAQTAPHVLSYAAELVIDGRKLEEPVNYVLVRIIPSKGVEIDLNRRPFVVVDPRAGHGPGIGGFKADSEIGVAMKAGHPCYFIGFLPEPMPGQTIERIARAEAIFIEKVIERHPNADGKPCVIGNCQAGWAVMILASLRPELFGPLIIAGAPLAYWAGVQGKYPMRYSGGLLGGSWLTALTSDLGAGKFDGAWLVQNFESQNPSNTLWTKQYNVYSKVDTEADRYLEFERWWGGHVNLNAEEIQFIVDELFIGNNLAAGRIKMSDGTAVDLRNIRSPIVVFCSKGDNVTPPQQALHWILDLYADVDEIRAYGQTIVYTVHETIGHLGIFVSGGVAKKEHAEFSSNIDLIDVLPPGLYEATFEARGSDTRNDELAVGQWVMRCEARTLDDIRAMGGNSPEDERRFETAKRVSEMNLEAYQKYRSALGQVDGDAADGGADAELASASPAIRDVQQPEPLDEGGARTRPRRHAKTASRSPRTIPSLPSRRRYRSKSSVRSTNGATRRRRSAKRCSWRSMARRRCRPRSASIRSPTPSRRREMDPKHRELLQARIAELKSKIGSGGLREAGIRALLYVGSARGMVDERSLEALRRMRLADQSARLTLAEFKMLVREQFFMLLLDREAALAAIPKLLPDNMDERRKAFAAH